MKPRSDRVRSTAMMLGGRLTCRSFRRSHKDLDSVYCNYTETNLPDLSFLSSLSLSLSPTLSLCLFLFLSICLRLFASHCSVNNGVSVRRVSMYRLFVRDSPEYKLREMMRHAAISRGLRVRLSLTDKTIAYVPFLCCYVESRDSTRK